MRSAGTVRRARSGRRVGFAIACALLLGACATPPPADDPEAVAFYKEANDPLEPMNRAIFDFNITLDRYTLKPLSYVYKEVVPELIQNMVRHFIDHLKLPVIFVNDLLQGELDRANNTFLRVTINTVIGFGGIADPATEFGFPPHNEDFDQTLAVFGLESGPYLMLPFLGPSTPRGLVGRGVDMFTNPLTYMNIPFEDRAALYGTDVLTLRAKNYDAINSMEKTSLDFYAAVRSLYWQRLKDEINNGRQPKNLEQRPLLPDEGDDGSDSPAPGKGKGN